MDFSEMIRKNLFFKVDFNGKYKKIEGKIRQDVKFFLIGVLPVVVTFMDDTNERTLINIPVEVESNPFLRMFHGAKFKNFAAIEKDIRTKFKVHDDQEFNYKKDAKEIIEKANRAFKKISESGEFMGKKIKTILIINSDINEYAKK